MFSQSWMGSWRNELRWAASVAGITAAFKYISQVVWSTFELRILVWIAAVFRYCWYIPFSLYETTALPNIIHCCRRQPILLETAGILRPLCWKQRLL
jgi:hypothetical protein